MADLTLISDMELQNKRLHDTVLRLKEIIFQYDTLVQQINEENQMLNMRLNELRAKMREFPDG